MNTLNAFVGLYLYVPDEVSETNELCR